MRVTQGMEQAQFLTAINQLESSIATNQNEHLIGTLVHHGLAKSGRRRARLRLQPGARAEPAIHDQRQQRTEQLEHRGQRAHAAAEPDAEPARPRPRGEQRHRVPQDLSAIATQVQQIQRASCRSPIPRTASGNYIFAGYSTQTQPFARSATGATYSGDQGQRQVQIGAGQTVVVGDNGDLVFNQIKNGNGTFNVTRRGHEYRHGPHRRDRRDGSGRLCRAAPIRSTSPPRILTRW